MYLEPQSSCRNESLISIVLRFTDEAVEAYFESSTRKLVVDVQSAAMEVLQLLNL